MTFQGETAELIKMPSLANDCVIKSVTTSMRITAAGGLRVGRLSLRYRVAQTAGSSELIFSNVFFTGNQMGENCTDKRTVFKEGGSDLALAQPPYSGTFKPFGIAPPDEGTGNFDRLEGIQAGIGRWTLGFSLGGPHVLECWRMKLELERFVPPPLQRDAGN